MSLFVLTAAAAMLYPVAVDDDRLYQEGTYVSEAAQEDLRNGDSAAIHCLDLAEGAASHTRACLTATEWEQVVELAEAREDQQRAADQRMFAINLAQWYAGN